MNRGKFKGEFLNELMFFSGVAKRDLKTGFDIKTVEDELVDFAEAFYHARRDFDEYVERKIYFIKTYAYQIVNGNFDEIEINQLCNEIEAGEKIRVGK